MGEQSAEYVADELHGGFCIPLTEQIDQEIPNLGPLDSVKRPRLEYRKNVPLKRFLVPFCGRLPADRPDPW